MTACWCAVDRSCLWSRHIPAAGQPEEVTLGYSAGRRKSLKRKGKEYKRMSEHIGSFPIVMMSPRDIDLIRGTGTDRRRWMDMVISQSDATYLDALMRYNAALEQRNRQLRDGVYDRTLLEINEMMMAAAAETIHSARAVFVAELGEIFSRYHRLMASDDEEVTLAYESELNEPGMTMERLFELNRAKDGIIKHTSSGIHRDDIIMTLGGMDVRRTASEGQCKTFTIALRLAQYEFLSGATHLRPLLLLDDIFDKLDSVRVERIIRMVSGDRFGQIFITDTNASTSTRFSQPHRRMSGYGASTTASSPPWNSVKAHQSHETHRSTVDSRDF